MALFKKNKKEEETGPASSSRIADAVRNIFNATVQGQQKAVQADQAVARETNRQVTTAARNLIDATARGQQAATRANQAVAGAQTRRVQEAAQGIYSAVQQQQERAARDQMAAQQRRMQAPTRRAQDAAAGLYSAYLNRQESLADIQRRQNQSQADTMAGLYANAADSLRGANELYQRQLAGTDTGNRANELMTRPVLERATQRQSSLVSGDPKKGAGKYIKYLNAADFAVNSQAREDNKDATYNYINNLNGERERQQGYAMQRGADSGMEKYQLMTDEERGVYNYLYNTQGKTAANGFLARLDPELNEQYYSGQSKYQTEMANQDAGSRLAFSAATVAQQPVRTLNSLAAITEDAIKTMKGEEIDPNSAFRRASALTQDIRKELATYYDQQYPGKILGISAGDVYQSVMSAMDSWMNMATAGMLGQGAAAIKGADDVAKVMDITNRLGAALMSSEVAATGIAESKRNGYSNVGAMSLGMIRGGIEYLSEKLGGDWVIKWLKQNPASMVRTLVHAMVPEGMEEVMSDFGNEVVNGISDWLFHTNESYVRQAYEQFKADGSESPLRDTIAAVALQEWKSFAGGALSAAGSGTTFYMQNRSSINETARQLNTDANGVVQLMNDIGTDNPDAVRMLAEVSDATSVDQVREKAAQYETVNAAIDAVMQERGARDTENAMRANAGGMTYATEGGSIGDVTYNAVDRSKLNNQQKAIADTTERIAKILGVNVTVIDARGDLGGAYLGNGNIYLNIGAGTNLKDYGKAIASASFTHELTHWMQDQAQEEYEELKRVTTGAMSSEQLQQLIEEQMKNQPGLTPEQAMDEVVANACQNLLQDSKAFARLAVENQSLAQKILAFLRDFTQRMREAFAEVDFSDNLPIYHAVQAVEDHLDEMQKAFDEALLAARGNAQAQTNENTAGEGGVQYQAFKGYDQATGRGIYESNFPENSPSAAKSQRVIDLVQNVYSKKPIDLVVHNDDGTTEVIQARFDPDFDETGNRQTDLGKLAYGNRRGSKKERRVTLNLADDYYQILQDAEYITPGENYDEIKHPDVEMWHYFVNHILYSEQGQTETTPYAMYIDVKRTADGDYVYTFHAEEEKNNGQTTPQTIPATVNSAENGAANGLSDNSIANPGSDVKQQTWSSAESTGETVGVTADEQSESVAPIQFSRFTWNESDYVQNRTEAARDIASALGVSRKTAERYIDSVNGMAKAIADDAQRLDYEASPDRSSLVGNTEYGGSIDFSTLCKKRRVLTGTFTAIQQALPNTALTAEEVLQIRKMMKDRGYEVSCGLCYVEGSRAKMGEYAKQFLDEYAKTDPEYLPNMAEINTPEGLEQIRMEHPEIYEAYEKFMNKLAQRKPKLYQLATEYKNEILKKFQGKKAQVDKYNRNGGLRLQSFSDFEIIHLIDNMQVIMDMARVGLNGQAYTKVPEFAWAMGRTGLKINLSLIAEGVDENGNLILDEVEGMKRADAAALRNSFSDTVGTIVVVFNDEQLKAAMKDEFIDFIIPFHRSQWNKAQYELMGLPEGAKDYTPWQNESYAEPVYNKNGKPMRPDNYMPNEYWDFSKTGKENAETYLRMCAQNNRTPKFSNLLTKNADGSYSLKKDGSTDGYWKLLIDFKMYNNDGVGVPQQPVQPIFNDGPASDPHSTLGMLEAYKGGHQSFPVAQDVVDDFVKQYKQDNPRVQYQTWGGDIRRQLADAEREYMEHSDANDAEYDYRAQLEKINDLRRQIEEAESVNAEADNVNAETDTNPTIEALEREGRVSRGTYDVEKYGDTHPERGEVGRDGVRMCNTIEDLEAELNEVGGAKIRNDTGEYFARIRRKNDNGYLLTINRDGKRDISRSFGNFEEASAYAASYIDGQTQARTDAELDAEKSAPVRKQEPIEALTTGQVQDEAKRQKQNKAAEASTQSLRDRIRKTDEEIKALRRLEKTTGLTETQAKHKADLQETLEILNDELTSRKGRAKAKKEKVEVKGNKPVRSAAEAKNKLMDLFHTAAGQRADTNTKLDAKLAEITSSGKITEQNRQDILDMLIDAGMVRQEAEQEFRDVRDWLRGSRIYVSEHDRADFGDDWDGLRKSAWANGIYLTNNESDRSVDSVVSELAETFGTNMFPTDDAASDMLRNLVEQAGKGRSYMITFAEAVNNEARMEHVDPQEIWNDLSRQTDETLRAFAEKAKLEVDLKDRTASMLATERKRAEDRMERMAQRRRESEIREKTFKAIRRLKKLRGKAAADVKTQIDEAIRDIDTQARQLTINGIEDLQELSRVYEDAKKAAGYVDEENPGNFLKNPYIEERLNRLTQKHINEMDIDDVIELGRLVSALENTVKTNGKMIGEQFDSEVKTVADKVNAEVQSSRGAKPGFLQKWFAEEQLSPRRFLELLGGWKKGAMANLADSLEKGQTKMLDFQRRAAQLMDPFMSKKENRKWLKTASGKNAKWYTYSVANGLDAEGGGITGQTIEITPMMKVSLYLASLNEDNLRHIQTGGLVIPDKTLYMKGKTQEAFAQGKRVKMQPEAVRHIAASLTQEEKTFAGYLQKFFNTMSKDAINEVSVQLDGFERADVEQYFPIESSRAFLKSDVSGEARAQTVEGIGSIANERVHASNPIVLDDAYNVFMRQVDKVSRYYGYAIPIRNFQAVNNFVFHEEGNAFAGSIKDTINRKWGAGAENYITKMLADIQGGSGNKGNILSRGLSKLRGNLAGSTLEINPSVAFSQTASYPGAAQAVGWDGLAAGLTGRVDVKLIEKYTPLLWYRSQGYSTQEIGDAVSAQNKTLPQKMLASKWLNWIQTMDRMTVKRIWKAAEYRVTKDTGLKPGSKALIDSGMDPYYQKVAEVFNRAVYDTQPNYTDMERAQILRSDSDLTKFLTMYKTVPLQYYGMMTEAVGRLQAALKSGNKNEIRAARKYAADTFGGLLAANSVYVVMKALFKSFRGKDDDYRDEEGEITPESYFKQLGKDLAETYAGTVIGGAEAYSLISGWVNGEKFRAPEINVLSSVEDIANGIQSIFKAIDDDDPGKTAKAVKDAAESIAMVFGIPLKNMETYLMAAIRWIQPEAAMQYDSFFGGLNKGDLKGMDSDTIGSAASIIMNSRTGANMERAATDELSRLYAAGYTDAIPTAIQDSFEYAGNTVKIKDRGKYSETWGGVVGDNLEELTASESYINADDKTKEDMIRKLYQYATVQARMGADPEYTAEGSSTYGWTEKADAAMESGMDLPTVIAAMTTMNAMTADKVNGQTVKTLKSKRVEYIDGLKLDTEQKDALYELAGYDSGLEKAPWHSGISAEAGYTTGTNKPVINEAARKRAVEANYEQLTSSDAYKAADDQTKKAMIEKLNQYAEVQGMVTTDPDYLPTGTAGWTIWAETAEKAGIDLISAIDYATQLDSFKADYNEYGKAISGSKKDKVTKYIDALDLTNEQKDILYLKIYAENSLKYTPWHGYTGKKKKRRGGGRRGSGKKSTAAKKPVSVGKITPKYDSGIDISKLFPTTTTKKSGSGLSSDLAKIVSSGLDISELFKYTPTQKAPKGRTTVDFNL